MCWLRRYELMDSPSIPLGLVCWVPKSGILTCAHLLWKASSSRGIEVEVFPLLLPSTGEFPIPTSPCLKMALAFYKQLIQSCSLVFE